MPLGVEDSRITNGHMSASTYYNSAYAPRYGRLNSIYSWGAKTSNHRQYLQVYLGGLAKITGIATQGRNNNNYWVKKFYVSYSVDGHTFVRYKENKRVKVCIPMTVFGGR